MNVVEDVTEIDQLLEEGASMRRVASTKMNSVSSRSHALVEVKITQRKGTGPAAHKRVSKLRLVDLAGSERSDAAGANKERLKEGRTLRYVQG